MQDPEHTTPNSIPAGLEDFAKEFDEDIVGGLVNLPASAIQETIDDTKQNIAVIEKIMASERQLMEELIDQSSASGEYLDPLIKAIEENNTTLALFYYILEQFKTAQSVQLEQQLKG